MIKLPKQLYVTFQRRNKDEPRLGFMSPFGNDVAFNKRKATQDQWAYQKYGKKSTQIPKFKITEDNSVALESGDGSVEFMLNCYPTIIDNVALNGFSVSKTVRRGGSWSGNSTVWRIYDPRDFELEIRAENMAKLLDYCTIINGKIQDKCIWAREGANNVLLPEGSELFKKAARTTSILDKKMSAKDINIGDIVDIINPGHETVSWTYLGKYYCYAQNSWYDCDSNTLRVRSFSSRDSKNGGLTELKRFLFMNGDYIMSLASPKFAQCVGKDPNVNENNAIDLINQKLNCGMHIAGTDSNIVYVTEKPLNLNEISFSLEDVSFNASLKLNGDLEDLPMTRVKHPGKDCLEYIDNLSTHNYLTEVAGKIYMTKTVSNLYGHGTTKTVLIQIEDLIRNGELRIPMDLKDPKTYGPISTIRMLDISTVNVTSLQFKALTAKYGNVTRTLHHLGITYFSI